MSLTKTPGISVLICCYNSARLLPTTLEHLARQKFLRRVVSWEVIVVDNASTDDTAAVARTVWDQYGLEVPLAVHHQPIPGLSHAREMGIAHAQYEFLLFCDDDNWLSEHYIEQAFETLSSNSRISAVGGCGVAVCESTPPAWFDSLQAAYATGGQAPAPFGEVSRSRGFVYAAGAVFRYSHLLQLKERGFVQQATGRKGNKLSSGEDVELCYALLLNGKEIYYDERLQFRHFLTCRRLTWTYYKRMSEGFGAAFPFLMPYKILINKEHTRFKFGIGWLYISAFYLIIRNIGMELPRSIFTGRYYRVRSNLSNHYGFLSALIENHSKVKALYKNLATASWITNEFKLPV